MTALVVNELTVIAVGGKDRDRDADVYLYRGNTGKLLHHLQEKGEGAVRAIEALRLERHLVVAHDGGISTWDLSHCADHEPRLLRRFGRGDVRAMTVFYDPQGRPRLATASTHGIQIWDPGLEGSEHPLGCFARDINATAIAAVASEHPDPQLAIADDHTVSLWSMTTEVRERELPQEHEGQVRCLATSPTGAGLTLLGAADDRGQVVVWELPKVRSTTRPYGMHDRWVNALVPVPAGESLQFASASDDRTIRLWQPEPGPAAHILRRSSGASVQALTVLHATPGKPERLISGDEAGHLTPWKMPEGELCEEEEKNTKATVRALATIHDQAGVEYVVAAGAEAGLTVWDLNASSDGSQIRFNYPQSAGPTLVRALAVSAADQDGGELLAAGDSHGRVTVWRTADGRQLWTNDDQHRGQVRTLAWIPTVAGMRLASGGSDGNIYLWPPDGRNARLFKGHRGPVATLAALLTVDQQVPTPNGEVHLFVSGGADGTIQTWNPDTPSENHSILPAHPGWVRALLRLEHGGTLHVISGGDDGTVRQWVIIDGTPQSTRHEGRLPGFGDRPAQYDLLGRQAFQDVLLSLLRLPPASSPPRQPTSSPRPRQQAIQPTTDESDTYQGVPTSGPRVVAVQGAWGAGKTSLMRSIYEQLCIDDHTSGGWHTGPGPEWDQQPQPSGSQAPLTSSQAGSSRFTAWKSRFTAWKSRFTAWKSRFTAGKAARLAHGRRTRDPAQDSPDKDLPWKIVPVWFNPWEHKSADEVWAGLTQEIIGAAKRVLGRTDDEWHRYWFTCNLQRLDSAEIRRVLRRRMFWQPLLLTPLLAPVIAAAVAIGLAWHATIPYMAAVGITAAFIAIPVRWLGLASAYLPVDIIEGPVLSGFQASPGPFAPASSADDLLLRDPLYHARAGYLYLVQHDVKDLVGELMRRRYMLVVFIDDLDRCPPETVAEVFEAVNIFLAEQFAHAKFVIGLDPSVVAYDLAEVFRAQESRQRDDPDDPNLGWSFLRKLCQLTLTLPEIREAHTARLMRLHSPSGEQSDLPASEPSSSPATAMTSGSEARTKQRPRRSRDDTPPAAIQSVGSQPTANDNHDVGTPRQSPSALGADSEMLRFEADPVIRDHLRALMRLRPHQSVRETKRLLTLWAFYLRLLPRLLPSDTTSSAQFGRDVLTLAEILTRWPALVPKLGPASSPESGLQELIEAAKSEADQAQASHWHETLRRLGLDDDEFCVSCENLRELLNLYGNDEVAYYAECVL